MTVHDIVDLRSLLRPPVQTPVQNRLPSLMRSPFYAWPPAPCWVPPAAAGWGVTF